MPQEAEGQEIRGARAPSSGVEDAVAPLGGLRAGVRQPRSPGEPAQCRPASRSSVGPLSPNLIRPLRSAAPPEVAPPTGSTPPHRYGDHSSQGHTLKLPGQRPHACPSDSKTEKMLNEDSIQLRAERIFGQISSTGCQDKHPFSSKDVLT